MANGLCGVRFGSLSAARIEPVINTLQTRIVAGLRIAPTSLRRRVLEGEQFIQDRLESGALVVTTPRRPQVDIECRCRFVERNEYDVRIVDVPSDGGQCQVAADFRGSRFIVLPARAERARPAATRTSDQAPPRSTAS
jgi:hypothetical protein